MGHATGTFEVDITPEGTELDGAVVRMALAKTFAGDLQGTGSGLMLSGGDPGTGSAGYVAVERVSGRLGTRQGTFLLCQLGTMEAGRPALRYEVVPGSGTGELTGLTGSVDLTIEEDGTHRYALAYDVGGPGAQ